MRILIVEDDGPLRALIQRGLSEDGHVVDALGDGTEMQSYVRATAYDAIVLDLNLPGEDGLSILRRLRESDMTVPTLVLTARDAVEDVIAGLDAGADDYLRKPFAFRELEARLRSLARRPPSYESSVLRVADVEFDAVSRTATRAGRVLALTAKEGAFLEILMQNAGHIVTRRALEDRLWDKESDRISNVLDVYARRVRLKLAEAGEPGLLQTVRGIGYRLEAP
ncbi:MAG: response regulator transcription factor [Candidatus Eremiobacteraeota bacterium]|nr:response regulator transcription factor [Candidatus Eremiobacteraeota bacterium]